MNILIAGDFCPRDRVAALIKSNKFSFFDEIKDIIHTADYSIVNFECPVVKEDVKPILKCGPALRTDSNAINAIKYAGFDCVTLANNHFRDFGDSGCITTIEELKKQNIDYVGGGHNLEEAQRIFYKHVKGLNLAIINFCENEFSIASENMAGAAPIDIIDNYKQILSARANADFVLVIVHGGHEFYQLPSPRMKKLYRFFIEIGADAVVNHHQHCYSGYEYYQGKPIVYGLGNFCFDRNKQRNSIWNEGYCVNIDTENLSIKLFPYIQGNDEANVVLMNEEQRIHFNNNISEFNKIIADDKLLHAAFDKWVKINSRSKMNVFAPYFHKYLNAAAGRGWIPTKLNAKRAGILLNHIACEAHRDISIKVMSDKLNSII